MFGYVKLGTKSLRYLLGGPEITRQPKRDVLTRAALVLLRLAGLSYGLGLGFGDGLCVFA
jgi:hypothetical protein